MCLPISRVVLVLALSAAALPAQETTPLRTAGDRPVDVRHLKLELDVDLEQRRIKGTATLDVTTLRPLTSIRLDAVNHDVSSVRGARDEKPAGPLTFDNTGRELGIQLPKIH